MRIAKESQSDTNSQFHIRRIEYADIWSEKSRRLEAASRNS